MDARSNSAAFWSLAFAYADWNEAGTAYEQCRDLIFGEDIDASAYRILLYGKAFVIVVGTGIAIPCVVLRLNAICEQGESTHVPDEVVLTLALRHEQFRTPNGTRFERRANH